ncbi:inactive pancreatic lipase-related protein 1-like [Watersipora subatra]|uniref:inactive pancreatic lipase-related protein 1-like n=1 Tax=Watersipora subatra TaxID=2589382 RepID=UPI00355B43DD
MFSLVGFTVLSLTALCAAGQQTVIKVNPTLPTTPKSLRKITQPAIGHNSSICYKYVGCFDTYFPFDNTGGVLPNPIERVGTVFLLYTPDSKTVGQQLDYKDRGVSIGKTSFNPLYPTKFVIHGFSQNEKELWLHQMKDALLTTGPLNVIIVGWGEGASIPDYPKAVANTRLVARQIKLLIDLLVKKGLNLDNVHLIGHSLGAHISGYVGAAYRGRVGRISGLDPAGPFYEGKDDRVRLNPRNAKFVDVTHSNGKPLTSGGAGLFAPSGHVDFYPNGGQSQPGSAGTVISCSHSRSHYYFMESLLLNGCTLLAHPCSSWEDYQNGKCSTCGDHGCSELGYHSIEYAARGTFYLLTKGN